MILARRPFASLPLVVPPQPQRLAGRRVDRHDVAGGAGRDVEDTVDRERRRLIVVDGLRPEVVGLPAPGDLQVADVVRGDLIERGVPRAAGVAAVVAPLAIGGAGLSSGGGYRCGKGHQGQDTHAEGDGLHRI